MDPICEDGYPVPCQQDWLGWIPAYAAMADSNLPHRLQKFCYSADPCRVDSSDGLTFAFSFASILHDLPCHRPLHLNTSGLRQPLHLVSVQQALRAWPEQRSNASAVCWKSALRLAAPCFARQWPVRLLRPSRWAMLSSHAVQRSKPPIGSMNECMSRSTNCGARFSCWHTLWRAFFSGYVDGRLTWTIALKLQPERRVVNCIEHALE